MMICYHYFIFKKSKEITRLDEGEHRSRLDKQLIGAKCEKIIENTVRTRLFGAQASVSYGYHFFIILFLVKHLNFSVPIVGCVLM